jgi:hypothetical protein
MVSRITLLMAHRYVNMRVHHISNFNKKIEQSAWGSDQRHILRDRRPSTTYLPSLLGDVDKGIEIVYGE